MFKFKFKAQNADAVQTGYSESIRPLLPFWFSPIGSWPSSPLQRGWNTRRNRPANEPVCECLWVIPSTEAHMKAALSIVSPVLTPPALYPLPGLPSFLCVRKMKVRICFRFTPTFPERWISDTLLIRSLPHFVTLPNCTEQVHCLYCTHNAVVLKLFWVEDPQIDP